MNKNTFVKFSLTLVSAAVLAACSSSGGGSNDDAAAKAKQQEIAAQQQQENAEKAKLEAEKAKLEAEKAQAEKDRLEAEKAKEEKIKSTEEVGHKFVQKNVSNLNVGTGTEINSHASTSITSMRINLDPSLDTVVVAIPLDENGKARVDAPQAYLEDYDFRKDAATLAQDNQDGLTELDHIYIGQNTKNGADRNVQDQHLTKTKTKGTDKGVAVVYEKNRLNYTDYEGVEADVNKDDILDNRYKRTQGFLKSVDNGRGSVSEVYGYRTFAEGNSETDEAVVEAALNNAPFTRLVDAQNQRYADGQLKRVQYGRVTSNLHAAHENNFKDGKKLGDYGTKVAGFGTYGAEGTENHYFYRGINDTKYSATLAADLGQHYFGQNKAEGELAYQGHAVTYGISHNFNSTDGIPNAIGYKQELVSGTHVAAKVDLATKAVTGNLYDVWRHGNRRGEDFKVEKVELANFEGKLENNGSIAGTSTRKQDGDKGTFNANLFGDKAQELGGAIRSNESLQDKQWGAVFGAEVQNAAYVAPAPVAPIGDGEIGPTPEPTPLPAWGESTDQKDTFSPIK